MKKLLAWSIFTLTCMLTPHITYSAENQQPEPGLRIEGLDDLVKDTLKEAAKNLKDEVIPALELALNRTAKNAKDGLAESATPILISTAGLVITSAGVMLIYQGLKADSTDDSDNAAKKTNTKKLLGYGGALVALGFATIMHTSIRNYFNGPKL